MIQTIDFKTWPRKPHFDFFNGMDYPHINICADVNMTKTMRWIQTRQLPVFISTLYCIVKAVNAIEAFRLRIRDDQVVLHGRIHPSFTVLNDENLFGFAHVNFVEDPGLFFHNAEKAIQETRQQTRLEDDAKRDDYVFISCLPWLRFTSINHPIQMHPADSVPRITWGKIDGMKQKSMPVSVQVHHGLADGLHIGHFFETLQKLLNQPEAVLIP